ncbi:helix-turn-helix domain-containing protein [Hydrogenovibrio halophilus]|uniref:helix-turn-helix domain-containing protein n=1 Tax=Hydrogenovibrio halophilus TaxID=373391 RepID=UPI00039E0E43|nr:helix-turn-helix domain-containing protein [Hydrogenovibrio halophilus]
MTRQMPNHSASCAQCALQGVCFASSLYESDFSQLDPVVAHLPSFMKGDSVFSQGDNFHHLYAVRAGMVKVYAFNERCQEMIQGFYLPGDIIGLEAIASGEHVFNAVALDTTTVCALPYAQLGDLQKKVPGLMDQMIRLMSQEILSGRVHAGMLTQKTAEQRVAQFFLSMSSKYRARGYEHLQFRLNILHRDLANYLNLTPETVSRILGKFHRYGWMSWKKREVRIHEMEQLCDFVEAETA